MLDLLAAARPRLSFAYVHESPSIQSRKDNCPIAAIASRSHAWRSHTRDQPECAIACCWKSLTDPRRHSYSHTSTVSNSIGASSIHRFVMAGSIFGVSEPCSWCAGRPDNVALQKKSPLPLWMFLLLLAGYFSHHCLATSPLLHILCLCYPPTGFWSVDSSFLVVLVAQVASYPSSFLFGFVSQPSIRSFFPDFAFS